jgi:hypothetical protein
MMFAAAQSMTKRTATQRQVLWLPVLLAVATAACAPMPDEAPGQTSSPIIGGTAAPTCGWPTTVLVGSGCSGTLVHPRVVMTAKHCLSGSTLPSISFGEARGKVSKTVRAAKCYKHPQTDFAFCTLPEDIVGMPLVPVMAPCEMSELKMGAPIAEAGFGVQNGQQTGFGMKKSIEGTLVRAAATRTTVDVTSGTQDGEYFGDSGGPVFLKMPDTTWRLIGNDLTSPDVNGTNKPRVSTYTSVPYHVAWAEQQSGIDITPCHDATGWNPGPDCKGVPTNPGAGVGTWDTMCAGQMMVLAPTCGGDGGVVVVDASGSDATNDRGSDGPPNDGAPAAMDMRGPEVSDDVHGSGGPGDATAGTGGANGAGADAALPGGPHDAGSTAPPGLSGSSINGGCACDAGRPSAGLMSLPSLALLLAGAAMLRRRRTHPSS